LKGRRYVTPLFFATLLLLTVFSVMGIVSGNIPRVAQIDNISQDSSGSIRLQVVHLAPTSTHYVDVVEVEVNMTRTQFNQQPQDSNPFTIELDLGPLQGTATVMARAHCTLHGWGDWSNLIQIQRNANTSTNTGQIQIFPVLGVIVIAALVASILIIRRIRNR
jgi:desulfoferrodoxin (superoxide reductase-like protein)